MKESFYSWNEYSFHFRQKAQDLNISESVILGLLTYSKKLFENNLPAIYDLKHLSYLTGYRESYLTRVIARPQNFYRTFKIAKKNGHTREITEPLPGLKAVQYWILNNIIATILPNKFNNAYSKGKSVVTNAKFHTKQKMVLNMDIEKYFDNIKSESISTFFSGLGYNNEVSKILAALCTLNGSLPQGSPTSPALSSLLTINLDEKLFSYSREWGLRYSRYADDITMSGTFHSGTIISGVKNILNEFDFTTNDLKTKIKRQHQRQMVTGVVVNRKLSVKKNDLRNIRLSMFFIEKYGLESHVEKIQLSKARYVEHLLGKINFYLFVKKGNADLIRYRNILIDLIKSEKQGS
jgi:RNA-directed DNA polymerase